MFIIYENNNENSLLCFLNIIHHIQNPLTKFVPKTQPVHGGKKIQILLRLDWTDKNSLSGSQNFVHVKVVNYTF